MPPYNHERLIRDAATTCMHTFDDGDPQQGVKELLKLCVSAVQQVHQHQEAGGERWQDFTALAPTLMRGMLADVVPDLDDDTVLTIIVRTLLLAARAMASQVDLSDLEDDAVLAPPPLVPVLMAAAVDCHRQGIAG